MRLALKKSSRMRVARNWMHRECRFSFPVQEYRMTSKRKSFPDAKMTLNGCLANPIGTKLGTWQNKIGEAKKIIARMRLALKKTLPGCLANPIVTKLGTWQNQIGEAKKIVARTRKHPRAELPSTATKPNEHYGLSSIACRTRRKAVCSARFRISSRIPRNLHSST